MMQPNSTAPRPVMVRAVPIDLCSFLKFGGLAGSGGEAKQLVGAGLVTLNGAVETQKRRKLSAGDQVGCQGQIIIVTVA